MEADFWHQRWKDNEIAFHNSAAHPLLRRYFDTLSLSEHSRIFLPLCGKTLDIAWLLAQGHRVVGAELSELAIRQLFVELGVEPKVTKVGNALLYSAEAIDIFVGDIFELSAEMLGPVDAVYDRAALVALPEEMRNRYSEHLTSISCTAPQLLITFEYDQSLMEGPPFSVDGEEVGLRYGKNYDVSLLETATVAGGLKGKVAATERIWLLSRG